MIAEKHQISISFLSKYNSRALCSQDLVAFVHNHRKGKLLDSTTRQREHAPRKGSS